VFILVKVRRGRRKGIRKGWSGTGNVTQFRKKEEVKKP